MAHPSSSIDIDTSLGYLLKQASVALNQAMDAVLRPLGVTITHYSVLEQLARRPGLSNSELARGAFVTRQSMNVLVQALERDGLIVRAAAEGRALPTTLTEAGRQQLAVASAAVREVEDRMLDGLGPDDRDEARRVLRGFIASLG